MPMIEIPVYDKDIRIYKNIIILARLQLTSIQKRLSSNAGKLDNWLFIFRNFRIKKNILKILKMKESRVGERALAEMMDDYRAIESAWQGVEKEELDYIRLIVHGLRDVTEKEE